MSRCYPFPQRGYAGKWSSHEALILSIKLQKERERAAISENGSGKLMPEKSKSSDRKKDKDDRKKEKKDKEGRKRERKDKDERRKDKKEKKREKKAKCIAPVDNGKVQGSSGELLERSSVTEEHGQPIDSHNASCSSDSTGNSGKRKRVASSPSTSSMQSHGSILRIRLAGSQKRDEPSTLGSKEQEVGPVQHSISQSHVRAGVTLVKPESSVKSKDVITNGSDHSHIASTSTATLQPVYDVSRLKEKTTKSTSQKDKLLHHGKSKSSQLSEKLSSHDRKMHEKESLYNKLFVNWAASPFERTPVVDNEDDEGWLFGKKSEDRSAKRLRVSEECQCYGENFPCSVSAVMQPRAQFLFDIGIHALPYTVSL